MESFISKFRLSRLKRTKSKAAVIRRVESMSRQHCFISEFGGEALYGKHGDAEVKSSWSEDYQAQLYKDNLEMFKHIPNLRGTSPWILLDFRSPFRFHPHQGGEWNRKGLVSDQGQRKKAWYIMRDYYNQKKTEQ